jgi:hypothetical protein
MENVCLLDLLLNASVKKDSLENIVKLSIYVNQTLAMVTNACRTLKRDTRVTVVQVLLERTAKTWMCVSSRSHVRTVDHVLSRRIRTDSHAGVWASGQDQLVKSASVPVDQSVTVKVFVCVSPPKSSLMASARLSLR